MTYDALDRRHIKAVNGERTFFTWDVDALLSEQYEDESPREYVYYPGTFEPLALIDGDGQVYYYHNDLNGLPQELTRPNGDIVWSASYDAMGRVDQILVEEVDQPLRFQGQYWDTEIDLCYNRYRYYDPQICSFISRDPLGLAAGTNVYAYAPNVWKWIDPLGLEYGPWQIHSPGYPDVVQKGLHFYGTDGIELSVRPTHDGGITFKNAVPNEANDPRLGKAIKDAHKRLETNESFRKDILDKTREAQKSVIDHSKNMKGSLKDLAVGRYREMKEIQRNIENFPKIKKGCSK